MMTLVMVWLGAHHVGAWFFFVCLLLYWCAGLSLPDLFKPKKLNKHEKFTLNLQRAIDKQRLFAQRRMSYDDEIEAEVHRRIQTRYGEPNASLDFPNITH